MLSVSGARGIVGASMTPQVAARFARAFFDASIAGSSHRPLIVLGRDSRPSGAELANAVAHALLDAGCDVTDLGIVMTPTVGVMVQEKRAAGGLVITASHNPSQWNGIKCLTHHGAAPPKPAAEAVITKFRCLSDDSHVQSERATSIDSDDSANSVHLTRVLQALGDDAIARIHSAHFRVVLDSINGAGCEAGLQLLEALGCTVIHLNGVPDGAFAHVPEPIEENLRDLCAAVQREGAEVGFAQDPDGDRLAIVDERGTYIGEEYTLALCARRALERFTASRQASAASREIVVAANLSTSRMIDDIAATFRTSDTPIEVVRTAVGEANVVEALMAAQARGACPLIGGEGNGGVISPEICWVRDSLISMALVLDLLASRLTSPSGRETEGARSLGAVVASLPRYTMIKRKFDLSALGGRDAVAPMLESVKAEFSDRSKHPDVRLNDIDGIRIDFLEGWVHLRPSNTEPIVRLIAEGRTAVQCEQSIALVKSIARL